MLARVRSAAVLGIDAYVVDVETDIVSEQTDHYILTAPLTTLAIPATLHDSLMARLDRLATDGTLPALRVDGETRYDEVLVELVAEAPETQGAQTRRAMVLDWTRYEYATDLDQGAAPPPTATKPAPKEATAAAPHAWRMPDDLAEELDTLPPLPAETGSVEEVPAEADETTDEKPDDSRLIRTDGFETVDED